MHPELHRYLDGELPREALSPEAAREAAEWEALEAATALLAAERAPHGLEARIMAALPAPAPAPAWRRVLGWLVEPRPIRVRPIGLVATAAAAVLAALVLVPRAALTPPPNAPVAGVETDDPNAVVYVQFVYAADDAGSVSVAGDFNGWESDASRLTDADGDGIWTALVAVEPGLHKYMFVVDGEEWVTDPRAERYVDDGFGMRNALIAVALPEARGRAS